MHPHRAVLTDLHRQWARHRDRSGALQQHLPQHHVARPAGNPQRQPRRLAQRHAVSQLSRHGHGQRVGFLRLAPAVLLQEQAPGFVPAHRFDRLATQHELDHRDRIGHRQHLGRAHPGKRADDLVVARRQLQARTTLGICLYHSGLAIDGHVQRPGVLVAWQRGQVLAIQPDVQFERTALVFDAHQQVPGPVAHPPLVQTGTQQIAMRIQDPRNPRAQRRRHCGLRRQGDRGQRGEGQQTQEDDQDATGHRHFLGRAGADLATMLTPRQHGDNCRGGLPARPPTGVHGGRARCPPLHVRPLADVATLRVPCPYPMFVPGRWQVCD